MQLNFHFLSLTDYFNQALWLDIASHMKKLNQSECITS